MWMKKGPVPEGLRSLGLKTLRAADPAHFDIIVAPL
jgi:hypothetical protein